nr:hypothetical protein [Leptospiraceae bacterium]
GCNPQLKRTVLDKAPISGILAILSSGTYSLNVSVSGLVSPVEIKNHRSEILQISQNGKFQFPSKLSSGENYTVSISGTMSGQICSFDQSSGTAGSGDAAVAMTCTASEILPFFANAPAWNDYVKNDGTSVQSFCKILHENIPCKSVPEQNRLTRDVFMEDFTERLSFRV